MKILRSIGAIIVGWLAAVIAISGIEMVSGMFIYPPPGGKSAMEWKKEMETGTPAAREWLRSIPTSAMAMVQVAWAFGAMGGGFVAARTAGRAHLLHAGIIGAFVLVGTIFKFLVLKTKLDYVHPDWLLITGLLLPLPFSLLGGKLASLFYPPAPPSPPLPPAPDGAIQAGEPPLRSN